MTGPEHYQEAERLLAEAAGNSASMGQLAAVIAAAQVHATLALAAQQPPAPLYGGCAFCDDFGAEDHVRCYCARDCRKRGCGYRLAGGAS
jgi:hypothetical protein